MGGKATFSGTRHQSGVIALIAVHILARRPLHWLGLTLDTPTAVSGETGGIGDDARVEFEATGPIEVQAKHGMGGGSALDEIVDRLRPSSGHPAAIPLVLAIDRSTSTRSIQKPLRDDLTRLRSGRRDDLAAEAKRLVANLGDDAEVLGRFYVALVDVDTLGDAEAKLAISMLADNVLADPDQAEAAWASLLADAETVSANRERRNAASLELLLRRHGFELKPSSAEAYWTQQLDFTRDLINEDYAQVALETLLGLQQRLDSPPAGLQERQRLLAQISLCQLVLQRWDEARASARHALDMGDSVAALYADAMASYYLGEIDLAERSARRAIDVDPNAPEGWIALSLVSADGELPEPPDTVAQSPRFRLSRAELAMMRGDWQAALDVTELALGTGDRDAGLLLAHTHALLMQPPDANRAERLRRAVEIATEVIENSTRPSIVGRALTFRGEAHGQLGHTDEASRDLERARATIPADPGTVFVAAERALASGNLDAAAAALYSMPADADPMFATLKAELALARNDFEEAKAKLDEATSRVSESQHPDVVIVKCSMVAADLGDLDHADRLLSQLSSADANTPQALIARGRMALERNDFDAATELVHRGASRDPEHGGDYFHEFARRLLQAKQAGRAADVLAAAPVAEMRDQTRHLYATALFIAGRLAEAQAVIDERAAAGNLPVWALGLSAEIAVRAADVPRALRELTAFVEREPDAVGARLQLARILLAEGDPGAAREQLAKIRVEGISIREKLMLAHLLKDGGQYREAWSLGFAAFRAQRDDPEVERAVAGLIFPPLGQDDEPLVVAADTYVELRSANGATEGWFVCAGEPRDAWRHEISVEDAAERGLLDRKVGDVIVRDEGDWREERWTVQRVVPAIHQVAFEIIGSFSQRHPQEPYLGEKFTVSNEMSGLDLIPFIGSLGDRRKVIEMVLEQHRTLRLPLGFIASRIGVSLPELMSASRISPDDFGPLLAEWPGAMDQRTAIDTAKSSDELVLTRTALDTAHRHGLLDRLTAAYRIKAPRSLLVEVSAELESARKQRVEGVSTLAMSDDQRLTVIDVEPNDPRLVAAADALASQLAWLEENVEVMPRPLELLGSDEEDVRDKVGSSSYDALELAASLDVPMYADDLGLRRFALFGKALRSFSTVSLLQAMTERAAMDAAERDELMIQLIIENHAFVRPTAELLRVALRRDPGLSNTDLQRVFDLLGQDGLSLGESATLLISAIKSEVTHPLQRVPTPRIAELGMRGMVRRWPVMAVASAVQSVARAQMALIPQHFSVVEEACLTWVKRQVSIP